MPRAQPPFEASFIGTRASNRWGSLGEGFAEFASIPRELLFPQNRRCILLGPLAQPIEGLRIKGRVRPAASSELSRGLLKLPLDGDEVSPLLRGQANRFCEFVIVPNTHDSGSLPYDLLQSPQLIPRQDISRSAIHLTLRPSVGLALRRAILALGAIWLSSNHVIIEILEPLCRVARQHEFLRHSGLLQDGYNHSVPKDWPIPHERPPLLTEKEQDHK
ncbi:MAG: hypothetical protein U0836_06160 [Pirellulales bacterium]